MRCSQKSQFCSCPARWWDFCLAALFEAGSPLSNVPDHVLLSVLHTFAMHTTTEFPT